VIVDGEREIPPHVSLINRTTTVIAAIRCLHLPCSHHQHHVDVIVIIRLFTTNADVSREGKVRFTAVFLRVCFCARSISQKTLQLGLPNLTHKYSMTNPGNPIILGQKVKRQGHKSQNRRRHGSLYSCECWLVLFSLCSSVYKNS